MSRAKRLFKLIQKKLPGLLLCKDMLVIPPTEHIVRGFLLEATSEKDRVYLWKVVTPLLRPIRSVILDYSDRISGSEPELYIRRDAFEESADKVRDIIAGHIDYLRGVRHPHDFLRHASWVVNGSPLRARLDQALIHHVIGNVPQSVRVLRALDAEADEWDARRREYVGPLLKQIVRTIDEHPAALAELLREWEQQNIERLGLQPSRMPVDRLRLVVPDQA
jgi:hypothetical protein